MGTELDWASALRERAIDSRATRGLLIALALLTACTPTSAPAPDGGPCPDAGDSGARSDAGTFWDAGTPEDAGTCACVDHRTTLACFCSVGLGSCLTLAEALDAGAYGWGAPENQLRIYSDCKRIDFMYRGGLGPVASHFVYDAVTGALVGAQRWDDGAVQCGPGNMVPDPVIAGELVDAGCVMTSCRMRTPWPDGGTDCPN